MERPMTESEICSNLVQLEKFLDWYKAQPDRADPEADVERWRQAANAARAWIIARMAEGDDGK